MSAPGAGAMSGEAGRVLRTPEPTAVKLRLEPFALRYRRTGGSSLNWLKMKPSMLRYLSTNGFIFSAARLMAVTQPWSGET